VPEGPILIVEDDETILFAVAECLEMEGYRIVTATNGAAALALVEQQPPGLVLLDMRMPVLDGWGFVQAVRERGLALKILVMSAAADAGRWAQEIQALGAIAKPFELQELLVSVGQHYGPPGDEESSVGPE
jgi:two-component system chemotaxis response regulator CheY